MSSLNILNIDRKNFIINCLFSLLIFSFIAGNLVLNLNVLLIILISILFYGTKIINIRLINIDKIIISFFLYVLVISTFNNIYDFFKDGREDLTSLIKSILFLRYLILYFIIRYFIKENIISLKIFFISAFCAVMFVCLDIFYQLIFGNDIFGFEAIERRLSGPFGDEIIAGSFIQRFSLFGLFLFPIFFKFKNKKVLYLIIFILISIFLSALILAGNRIPLLFFILIMIALIIFEQKLRRFFFPFIIIASTIFTTAYISNTNINYHFHNFHKKIKQIFFILSPENILSEEELEIGFKEGDMKNNLFYTFEYKGNVYKITNSHLKEFKSGYLTWKINKYFGGGIKTFIKNCSKKYPNCGNHPHNYYLEILAELGLLGFFIIFYLFILVFLKKFVIKYFRDSEFKNYHLITPFIFLFFAEIFPIKSTGSFFTTGNATYIFLILSMVVSLAERKNLIEDKIL